MKHIKTLGALIVAAMALMAVVGISSASATTSGSFTATAGKSLSTKVVKAPAFTITGSEVTCNKVIFTGSTEGAETTSQTVTPKFEECGGPTLFTIINNGCVIKFTATTNQSNGHAEGHLEGTNCTITMLTKTIFGECHIELTPQTIAGVHYIADPGDPNSIIVQFTPGATLTDHVTRSTGFCPLTVGTHTNASWTGEVTVTASGGVGFMEMASAGAP